jgi:hypothetical protein
MPGIEAEITSPVNRVQKHVQHDRHPLLVGNQAKHGLFQAYFTVLTEWVRRCLTCAHRYICHLLEAAAGA